MNYKKAEKLAQRLSLENPDEFFYINWIDGYDYCVDNEPELDNQPFYKNGIPYKNETYYDYEVLGYHQEGRYNGNNN